MAIKLKDANLGTAAELVAFCKSLVGKWGYVYGTYGQTCTKALREAKAKQYPKYKSNYMNICPKWDGKKVCDCSGMFKAWALEQAKKLGISLIVPMASGGWDASANGAYSYWCTEKSTNMKTMPDEPGIALFYDGHIGIYVGNGEVVEARGSSYGVVKTKLKDRAWKKWGRLNWVTYGAATVPKAPESPATGTIIEAEDNTGVVSGGTVNVRSGAGTGYKILGIKRKGDVIPLIRQKDGWWEISAGKWISGKYVKVN